MPRISSLNIKFIVFVLQLFLCSRNVGVPIRGLETGSTSSGSTLAAVMLNYAGDAGNAGDGFMQDAAAAYPLIWSGGRRN